MEPGDENPLFAVGKQGKNAVLALQVAAFSRQGVLFVSAKPKRTSPLAALPLSFSEIPLAFFAVLRYNLDEDGDLSKSLLMLTMVIRCFYNVWRLDKCSLVWFVFCFSSNLGYYRCNNP